MNKIAIIGTSGLFPGSSSPEVFWDNLMQGKDLTGLATEDDFGVDPEVFFQPGKGVVDKCYSLRGGYIRDFRFDANGYELPADLLARQDKLYQWSLYVAKEALKEAGYFQLKEKLQRCGLILGNLSFPTASSHRLLAGVYTRTMEKALQKLLQNEQFAMQAAQKARPDNAILDWTVSQMASQALGLGAGHYTLDAACATSLYAIKLACDELLTGKADMMLAGAVCASDQLFIHMGFSIFHAYAGTDDKFVPLDTGSAGLVSSEGAGMVVLKRLEDAERDQDNILAVIGGIGLSNDGRGKFLLSPHPKGQRLAFERAYSRNDISPEDTSYLECHATGTPLGDQTEMNSIAEFFAAHQVKPLLGSVKSNMGHLLTAAGMSGLLKVLLAMQKGAIPPNINLEEAVTAKNGWIGREQMILKSTAWNGTQKQAGINSFGFGGTNAHMVVQNYLPREANARLWRPVKLQPLAIIGMDAHFGDCTSLKELYDTIYHGKQHFRALPEERWKGFDENEDLLKDFGFADGKAPKGAYIDGFEIDLLRYKIQPKEAETLEPQQALILKVADKALKDAGLKESRNVAVLIAMESELAIHHYLARWDVSWQLKEALRQSKLQLDEEQEALLEEQCKNSVYYREGSQTPSQHTSFVGNIMASRVAALWDFSGPAFTVSCGENSVFKALEVAQNLLSIGEVEAVVVGGVDFSGGLESVLLRNKKEKVNPAARPSLSLNEGDNGWLVGEGAGAVVLKKLSDAQQDKIYAVIDGVGESQPLPEAGYLELVATGKSRQDEAEWQSLLPHPTQNSIALGSIKANIGHTFAASGMAGLIKTALCLHHRFIPGIPNWTGPKDPVAFEGSGYYFPEKSRPWILEGGQSKRCAAVNGPDGRQIHLSEATHRPVAEPVLLQNHAPKLFTLKGQTEKELQQQLSALEIAAESPTSLSEIALQFYKNNQAKETVYCLALIAKDRQALLQDIRFFQINISSAFQTQKPLKTPGGSYFSPRPLGKKGKVAFVYPGSSTAYPHLGQDLFQLFPPLFSHFEEMLPRLDDYLSPDYLFPKKIRSSDPPKILYDDAVAMMSAGVFFSSAYTHILRKFFKLEPQIAFGYSMGECSSMWYALGIWNADETKNFQESPIFKNRLAGRLELLAEQWGITTDEAQNRWGSLVLLAPRKEVEALVAGQAKVFLPFINTDNEVVIAGDRTACLAIAEQLNCKTLSIPFQNVIHNDFCEKERAGLLKMHHFPIQEAPAIDFYSSITLSKIALDSRQVAENSTAVCCRQVDFPRTVKTAYEAGARIFIELGANATCTGWIKNILKEEHLAVSIDQKGKPDARSILELMAQLYSHKVQMDLSMLYTPVKEEREAKSFMKKIIPGGNRIFDTILSEDNQRRFSAIERRKARKKPMSWLWRPTRK